jgi:hypothetical protein
MIIRLGVYSFDVSHIYFQNKHAIFHQWVALTNPSSKEYSEITGYLKLSISAIATGDE